LLPPSPDNGGGRADDESDDQGGNTEIEHHSGAFRLIANRNSRCTISTGFRITSLVRLDTLLAGIA
jgi:hypothetical protein